MSLTVFDYADLVQEARALEFPNPPSAPRGCRSAGRARVVQSQPCHYEYPSVLMAMGA